VHRRDHQGRPPREVLGLVQVLPRLPLGFD
jgi:hypothetical protein